MNDILLLMKSSSFNPPKKSRKLHYLPKRMENIFGVVELFSNLDLKTGKSDKRSFFTPLT